MKLKVLATAVLATTTMGLSVARPGLSQTNLNAQLRQAICTQNWSQAVQVVDQMKKVSTPEYASQLTMYRGQLTALASSGARVPSSNLNCSAGGTAIASNSTPARVVGTDQAFLADYRHFAASVEDSIVRTNLLNTFDNSSEFRLNGIQLAKSTCKLLRLGSSWSEIQANQVSTITANTPLIKKSMITDFAITNTLATAYYCPEFASR